MSLLVAWLVVGMTAGCGDDQASDDADTGQSTATDNGPEDESTPVEIDVPTTPRPFRLGFRVFPYDSTGAAFDATWDYVGGHSDIIALNFADGLPWQELIDGAALPAAFSAQLDAIEVQLAEERAQLYLAVDLFNGARNGIAADSEGRALPESLEDISAGDPIIRAAYTELCLMLLERFEPDYFAPVQDLNVYLVNRPSDYDNVVDFYQELREALKRERVETQVFPTWDFDLLAGIGPNADGDQFIEVRLLDQNIDRVALRVNPVSQFVGQDDLATDYLSQIEDFASRDVVLVGAAYPSSGFQAGPVIFPSSEASQFNFLALLMTEADRGNYDFIIWEFSHDILSRLEEMCPGRLASPAEPCDDAARFDRLRTSATAGFVAQDGTTKSSAALWNDFFARSYQQR